MGKYWKRHRKKDRKRFAAQEAIAASPATVETTKQITGKNAAKRATRAERSAARKAAGKARREAQEQARVFKYIAANTNSFGIVPNPEAKSEKGSLSRTFNVYADGSARGRTNDLHMGAGWIIFETTGGKAREFSRDGVKVTEPVKNGTSVFAEIAAATKSLNAVPAASRVKLHLDCQTVIDVLKERSIEKHLGHAKRHADMRIAAGKLFNAVARHEYVEVIKIKDTATSPQRIAHHLAKNASKAGNNYTGPE